MEQSPLRRGERGGKNAERLPREMGLLYLHDAVCHHHVPSASLLCLLFKGVLTTAGIRIDTKPKNKARHIEKQLPVDS